MNRKLLFSMVVSICIIALTACTTVAPTTSTSSSTSTITSNSSDTVRSSTLACSNGGQSAITPELTEGPYFTANSPERADLLDEGVAGTKIVVTGYVYTTDCQPVANALLDFWQADGNGVYDNSGYILRGHQYTDANGRYQLTTVVPGIYPGRTEHIHVKVQAPNGKMITSQLFFPGVSQNDSDGIYDQSLLLTIEETSDGLQGQFNFVVPAP
jgi:protocatechuate 3,4-dioxygenase beta subunit